MQRVRWPSIGRNTLATPRTNNFDLGVYKDLNITERMKFRFGAQFANIINHAQYIPGSNPGQGLGVNDVSFVQHATRQLQELHHSGEGELQRSAVRFASNARTIALVAKFTF